MLEYQWEEKWRPTELKDLTVNNDTIDMIQGFINQKKFPNCTLGGHQGIGKTTIAKIVCNELNAVTLFINASIKRGIDTVRNEISEFTESIALDEQMKIVILDEVDGFSQDAWQSLRGHIEECADDTRFILTCNYPDKILPPVLSRCKPINISSSPKDILKRLLYILEQENIKINDNDKKNVIGIIREHFPDVRSMIGHIEMCSINGKFQFVEFTNSGDKEMVVKYILDNIKDHKKCRKYWIENETKFNRDYIDLAGLLYNTLSNGTEMDLVANHLRWINTVLDKDIEFSYMISKLGEMRK